MIFYLLCLLTINSSIISFNKVVIWGHKLHSHTHSYIHNAFYKAFKHLGYDTYWFDNQDNVDSFDFSNTLFITETQVDARIPLREDCRYILHNCDPTKYQTFIDQGHCIFLCVYRDDTVLTRNNLTKIDDCIYYDLIDKAIYMPWATDLLPYEIDTIKKNLSKVKKEKKIYWIGTVGGNIYGNIEQLRPFIRACKKNKIKFRQKINLSIEENIKHIQHSYMAPAIVGDIQENIGYIPCRIFKNISYGQMGITNSWRIYELFKKKIVYNSDTYQLFFDAKKRLATMQIEELYELMDFVRDKHTYINRIETLLFFLNLVEKNYAQKN